LPWVVSHTCYNDRVVLPFSAAAETQASSTDISSSVTSVASSSSSAWENQSRPPFGPIDDDLVKCQMQDLEQANDSQLYEILQELKQTPFFRNFMVDLQHKCPLASWSGKQDDHGKSTTLTSPTKQVASSTTADDGASECSGGDVGADLDSDAEPLCTVQTGGIGPSKKYPPFMDSNALAHLRKSGFESQSQRDAFAWKHVTNAVLTEVAPGAADPTKDVSEDALRPDAFWEDMCSSIGQGDGSAMINLALNPERNTGYNGTHIWRAIYEENCSVDPTATTDMCLEERVLYRLLSGLHTSTTVAIANNYYPPSKKKGRASWTPNSAYFMEKFSTHPEHIRNLHFSYVVLLRALGKAAPFLYEYADTMMDLPTNETTPENDDGATTAKLLRRLLDSSILRSCNVVFAAFDESLMFQEDLNASTPIDVLSIQKNFKGVFHNVSAILDCVQCQQCKLHGKLAMLGYGAALKVLFMPASTPPSLERNEIVALINAIIKLSESVRHVRELTELHWQQQTSEAGLPSSGTEKPSTLPCTSSVARTMPGVLDAPGMSIDSVDKAVGVIAALGRSGLISLEREEELVQLALQRRTELLILTKHYGSDFEKLLLLTTNIGELGNAAVVSVRPLPDAIIVGSGLAGMAAALNILDRGGRIVIVEKEHLLGGNSNKASSGINACCPDGNSTDSIEIFMNDTVRSAGSSAQDVLISTLVSRSAEAIEWLRTRVGVDLSLKSQLGGHSTKRTHRPSNGMAGAEIIYGMQKAVKAFVKTGEATILTDTKVTRLLQDDSGSVVGVECLKVNDKNAAPIELFATNVVLATGGFAADRSSGSYLERHRPELLRMPTTAGAFSTGDGITLATALGAATVDMDKVQVHPTGWVDPADPDNTSKVLAAELMRGVGGLLINDKGERFCNELGTRSYVTNKMLSHDAGFAKTGNWSIDATVPSFSLVLSSSAASNSKKHVDLYTHKGVLSRLEGVDELAKWMGLPKAVVLSTLVDYQMEAATGKDRFGKTTFDGVPSQNLDSEIFYAGKVTPVLHYCMGGVTIDVEGNVLDLNGETIPGLHAAGEVSGGVHGVNRLAGNSLLECTVFGSIVGKKLPINKLARPATAEKPETGGSTKATTSLRKVPRSELEQHGTPDDCWVAIHGVVYDLTEFADEHPAGPLSIHELAGQDGTEAFAAVHNRGMLDDFSDEIIGAYSQ
jgi:flavocytochrome c